MRTNASNAFALAGLVGVRHGVIGLARIIVHRLFAGLQAQPGALWPGQRPVRGGGGLRLSTPEEGTHPAQQLAEVEGPGQISAIRRPALSDLWGAWALGLLWSALGLPGL